MALVLDYKEGALKDIRENPEVAKEYYREAIKAVVNGETDVANTMFRDLIHADIGLMRRFRTVLLLANCAWAMVIRAETLTNCMELVTYNPRQCYHVVCTNEQFNGVELCIDETGRGWSVCCHHTNGWGYVACRTNGVAVSYLDFRDRKYTVDFTTNDFYVAFSWNPKTPTGGLDDYNGWVHLRSPNGKMEIVASAMETKAGERCLYPETDAGKSEPPDDPVIDPEANKWEWLEIGGEIHLCECCIPRDIEGTIAVPSTINGLPVVAIRSGVFSDYKQVSSFLLPDTIRAIADGAFRNCSALIQCTIPTAVTNIDHLAFAGCTALATAEVSFGVEIHEDAFPETCKVTCRYPWANVREPPVRTDVIPSAVSNIASNAYSCDDAIQSLLIPDWVTNMEYAACCSMQKLGAVVIGSGVRTCDSDVFSNCPKLTNVVIRNGNRIIGERMFADCAALTTVTIPPSVRIIGTSAFAGCSALKSVLVPFGIEIATDAFPKGCTITRVGPSVELATINYDDDRDRLMRLLDPEQWGSAFKVNFRMETTDCEYDLVKRFSYAGISAARYEMQNDGTLVAYFDKPELKITELSPTDGRMLVKVSPASGSSIVAPIDIYTAIFVTTSDNASDLMSGKGMEYCGGYDLEVDASDYESDGVLRIDLTNALEGNTSQFFKFSLSPLER